MMAIRQCSNELYRDRSESGEVSKTNCERERERMSWLWSLESLYVAIIVYVYLYLTVSYVDNWQYLWRCRSFFPGRKIRFDTGDHCFGSGVESSEDLECGVAPFGLFGLFVWPAIASFPSKNAVSFHSSNEFTGGYVVYIFWLYCHTPIDPPIMT